MAKLRIDQLIPQLDAGLACVYLISGDEILLQQESGDAVRQRANAQGFAERECYHVDKTFHWPRLSNTVNTRSLFSDKKLIELRMDGTKLGDQGATVLCDVLSQLGEDCCLLIISPKLDAATQRSQWVKAIEKVGHWLPLWPVTRQQFPAWLAQRIAQAGLKVEDRRCIDILVARTEGNLLAAQQEIEKLTLLADNGHLSVDLLMGAVADSARYDIFGLRDAVLLGDAPNASRMLQGLRAEGVEATLILWGFTREIHTLFAIAKKVETGQDFGLAAKQTGVWAARHQLVDRALQRMRGGTQLHALLRQANAIDKAIKGVRDGDCWHELLELAMQCCGVASLSKRNRRLSLLG